MTYFTHTIRPDYRCSGCGRHLVSLMRLSRWVGNTVAPICADADLTFLAPGGLQSLKEL